MPLRVQYAARDSMMIWLKHKIFELAHLLHQYATLSCSPPEKNEFDTPAVQGAPESVSTIVMLHEMMIILYIVYICIFFTFRSFILCVWSFWSTVYIIFPKMQSFLSEKCSTRSCTISGIKLCQLSSLPYCYFQIVLKPTVGHTTHFYQLPLPFYFISLWRRFATS